MVKDMIFQLDERDLVRPEINHGINIEPVVIFLYLQVYFAAAKQVAFLPFGLLYFKTLGSAVDHDAG